MNYIISFAIGALLLTACGGKPQEQNAESDSLQSNSVTLTSAQYQAAHITMGKVQLKSMAKTIQVNGKLDVPPQNLITISAPMGGFVKSTNLLQGMKVNKGDVLVTLENQDYIQLQQDYLDSQSKLEFLEAEYKRQEELARENVNAQKVLQQSKSQYESMKAMVGGLEAKLTMINLSPASLKDGKIKSTINLYAPITGYITTVNVNIGQFVGATDVMFNIVNLDHIHAELQVFEKDISKIAVGQKVNFQLANDNLTRLATVYLIGREISPERTVRVHCHLQKEDDNLLPGMFVTAVIETSSVEVNVVPSSAIVNFEGDDYVFVSSGNNQFKAIHITIGNSVGEFTEVQLDKYFNMESSIVITGAFELLGMLKNTEEE